MTLPFCFNVLVTTLLCHCQKSLDLLSEKPLLVSTFTKNLEMVIIPFPSKAVCHQSQTTMKILGKRALLTVGPRLQLFIPKIKNKTVILVTQCKYHP
uniref:Uncharacterized protein n=1 Tax=Anguilla anguilla TaxID=7936 RepID=A0A0E9STE3_ANGAN